MLEIPRSTKGVDDEQPPLSWRPLKAASGGRSALFVCPNGHDGTLLDHEIAADGTVTPSVDCPGRPAWPTRGIEAEACDFHDMILLKDWPHG